MQDLQAKREKEAFLMEEEKKKKERAKLAAREQTK